MNMKRPALLALVAALTACAAAPSRDATPYEATITRTQFGIAHIKAADFGGLGYGDAYARAQDNVCLLADSYVSAAGERSKYFGADGPAMIGLRPAKNLDSDVFQLAVTDLPAMRAAFARSSADYKAMVDGWIAGYNRFLRDRRDSLPAACAGQPWVREIGLDDMLRAMNTFSILSSSATLSPQIANAAPSAETVARAQAPLPDPLAGATIGSNGWAFGGDATSNGRGLVLANPHFPWTGPNRFYETHLTIPGKFDIAGAAITTLPFVGIGFNRDVAWTHTVDMALHMTLYKLALDPADPTAYLVDGRREAMTRREVRIEIKDAQPVTRTLYATRYGPMLSVPGTAYAWTKNVAYAVADANNGNIRSGDTWLDMARARNVRELREALARHLGAPFINTMAADREGTVLYADITAAPNVSAQKLADCGSMQPRLPGNMQELAVLDGSRSACAWEQSPDAAVPGLLPASQMATLYRRDYVQNSNDTYRWSNPAERLELGPIMGHDPGLGGLRTRSAIQEIGAVLKIGKFNPDLAAQTMLGNKVLAADLALPGLLKLCKQKSAPAEACAALAQWDGKAELASRGAMLFNQFWVKVGQRADIWKTAPDPQDPIHTPRDLVTQGKVADELLAALAAAAEDMKKLGAAPDAPLGEVQYAERGAERIPISGLQQGGTLNYTRTIPGSKGYQVIFGASYMQAVTFDERGPVAKAVLSFSQSTDPASPHYADQTRGFSSKQFHRYPYSEAEIAQDAIAAPLTIRQ